MPDSHRDAGEETRKRDPSFVVRSARTLAVLVAVVFGLWITGCMERQFYHPEAGPTPVPSGLRGAEEVAFVSGDGTRLNGWFIPAQTPRTGTAAPTILHVHGNAGNIESHLGFSQGLTWAGFNLFIFDYRGYGQSAGKARVRDDLIADTEAAIDVLLARADIDPARVGMFGHSLGGAIGLNAMATRDQLRVAVIEAAFSSWRDVAADAVAAGQRPGPVARMAARLLIRDHRRPDEAIARIDRPILLVHGDEDRIVPVHHAHVMRDAATTADYIEVHGGAHNTLRETDPDLDAKIAQFFHQHLSP